MINFKVADNILAGVEFEKTAEYGYNHAQLDGALIIGKTTNTEERLDLVAQPHGVIASRSEYLMIKNCRFFNLNWRAAAGLGTCSHCFHPAATDSGARTTETENLFFDPETVPRRIKYQVPFKAIFHDLDGTLTGKGPDSWASFWYKHHD